MDRSLYIARIGSGFLQQKWNDSSRHFRSGGILVEVSDKLKQRILEDRGYWVETLASVTEMDGGRIKFD